MSIKANYKSLFIATLIVLLLTVNGAEAQQLYDRVGVVLSPMERTFHERNSDILLLKERQLYANPAYNSLSDTLAARFSSIVYGGIAGGSGDGDFLPYQGNGSTDSRIGAYGVYNTPRSGTLSGNILYARGSHRRIGWSAMREPELYMPYFSTDSTGGDYKFESYHVAGDYSFTLDDWTLGARMAFSGEQAHRSTDPRALNNTTWLRFNLGAAKKTRLGSLLLDAGYARNKQHVQLRYWRPGEQNRFFVCYGFGLYDIRQSAVLFGKARMFYVDEFNSRLQFLSAVGKPLGLHASVAYRFDNMKTEESDIYNLYEAKTHIIEPNVLLTFEPDRLWRADLSLGGMLLFRKGYENIIEEYLIDKPNNIYDFRTVDTQQNYCFDDANLNASLRVERRMGALRLSAQGGISSKMRRERYKNGGYSIRNDLLTPHFKVGFGYVGVRDELDFSLLYGRQNVSKHKYDVTLSNQEIEHLDFQHAFTQYAYYASEFNFGTLSLTYKRRFGAVIVGVDCKLYVSDGARLSDVAYEGKVGFMSSAPTISTQPDKHNERWGTLSLFLQF